MVVVQARGLYFHMYRCGCRRPPPPSSSFRDLRFSKHARERRSPTHTHSNAPPSPFRRIDDEIFCSQRIFIAVRAFDERAAATCVACVSSSLELVAFVGLYSRRRRLLYTSADFESSDSDIHTHTDTDTAQSARPQRSLEKKELLN